MTAGLLSRSAATKSLGAREPGLSRIFSPTSETVMPFAVNCSTISRGFMRDTSTMSSSSSSAVAGPFALACGCGPSGPHITESREEVARRSHSKAIRSGSRRTSPVCSTSTTSLPSARWNISPASWATQATVSDPEKKSWTRTCSTSRRMLWLVLNWGSEGKRAEVHHVCHKRKAKGPLYSSGPPSDSVGLQGYDDFERYPSVQGKFITIARTSA